jgi:hypothetical protein
LQSLCSFVHGCSYGTSTIDLSVPRIELHNGLFGEFDLPAQVVRLEDSLDVTQAVSGDGRDLGDGAAGDCQSGHSGAAQVVKVQILIAEAGAIARLTPRGAETVRGPRFAERVA